MRPAAERPAPAPDFAPEAAEETRFDHETDVLVVGYGCAGASAAWEAADAGASVLVLERAGGAGGSSALSGGELYLGGGTAVQRACGFEDSADGMAAYLTAALGPHADEEKIRLYCADSADHFRWLTERGVTFRPTFFDAPTWMPLTEDGLMWLGENSSPYNRLTPPVPRGHRPEAAGFGGRALMDALTAAAGARGVTTHTDTRATGLVTDRAGRITGVVARRYGRRVAYRARRGVVLTTGGFVDNARMLADHAPRMLPHGKVSDGLDDGSGIEMAQAAGAAVRRMSVVQTALTVLPGLIARGMLVNGAGARFVNEDTYPGLVSHSAVHRQPGPCWTLVDEQGYEEMDEGERWGVRPRFVSDDLAELEKETGLPAGSLRATVALYNDGAARGEDPLFGKDPRWLRPLRPPYAAIDPGAGFGGGPGGASGFTLGGLTTTADGEVLGHSGHPLPGLYAAGRASSGMHGESYISGTSLGDGTYFGRRAGRAAAGA